MLQRKRKSISHWAEFVGIAFMLAFFVIVGRFVYIAQMKEVKGHQLIKAGENQWSEIKLIDEKRGTIFSSNGQIMAEDVPAYSLYAVISPKAENRVKNKEKTAKELAPILGMKASDILESLNRKAYQVEFGSKGRMLSYGTKEKIDQLKLPGIYYMTESRRDYPEQSSAAYTLGFTQLNSKNDEQKGVFGIEQSLDRYLSEKDGSVRYYRSLNGVPIPDEKQKLTKAYPGDNVYLTLNTRIQTVLDQAMDQVSDDYKPASMIGIVADPKTGKILAMSNYPNFNPNKRDIKQFTNLAISDPYEPGSVMKTFTIASAIDAGVYNGKATYPSGSYQTDGGVIHDWDRAGWGSIDFDQGFQLSSNVGMSILTDKYLKPWRLKEYLNRFGFMDKTGIDLPGEGTSRVNWQYKIDQLEASFGQGSAFTAMQIVKAATAIANNGTMMKPYLVNKIVNPDSGKVVLQNKPVVSGHPISKLAAEKTRALLRKVVSNKHVIKNEAATGVAYDLPGYDVIGKTGTAQIGTKTGYLMGKNNYIYSFLGMAPEKNPRLIIYVAVKQPHLKPTDLGEEPVEAIVRPVMASSLQYLQVQKKIDKGTDMATVSSHRLGEYTGQSMSEAAQAISAKGLTPISIGDGTVEKQMPYTGESLIGGSRVILYSHENSKLPDMTGWSLGDVMKLAEVAGLKLREQGNGFVKLQKPETGTVINRGETLSVDLSTSLDSGTDAQQSRQSSTDSTGSSNP